jgi:hypothetical protein
MSETPIPVANAMVQGAIISNETKVNPTIAVIK